MTAHLAGWAESTELCWSGVESQCQLKDAVQGQQRDKTLTWPVIQPALLLSVRK